MHSAARNWNLPLVTIPLAQEKLPVKYQFQTFLEQEPSKLLISGMLKDTSNISQ